MRAVVQRVKRAGVTVEGSVVGEIEKGVLVLLGVGKDDNEKDAEYLAEKVVNLRIFDDEGGKMNLSLPDIGGSMLVVSQFTLYGDCRKGRRPGYDSAAAPDIAQRLYHFFVERCRSYGVSVETGKFQAMMQVELLNDGPVTLLIDSKKVF